MSSKFECFVEIYDQKYDIVINNMGFSIKFSEIYPKVQQIVKIGLNEDISFITHKFEIIEYMCLPNESTVVSKADQLVEHKSRIRINGKPQQITSLTTNALSLSTDPEIAREEKHLLEPLVISEIKGYHSIVMAINIEWDFTNGYEFHNWDKVFRQMLVWNCPQLGFIESVFYRWTMYFTKNYYRLNGKMNRKSQQIFDLLKIVDILDLDKLYERQDPIPSRIASISRHRDFIDFYTKFLKDLRIEKILTKGKECSISQSVYSHYTNHIQPSIDDLPDLPSSFSQAVPLYTRNIPLLPTPPTLQPIVRPIQMNSRKKKNRRNKKNKKRSNISKIFEIQINIQNNREIPLTDRQLFVSVANEELKLRNQLNEIKNFYKIVLAINIGWDFVKSPENWYKVSETIKQQEFTAEYCSNNFLIWSRFYVENYDKLNGQLNSLTQSIFDLLKVIHVLNLKNIFGDSNQLVDKLRGISFSVEGKLYYSRYLKDIRSKKMASNEWNNQITGVTQRQRSTYQKLLKASNSIWIVSDEKNSKVNNNNNNNINNNKPTTVRNSQFNSPTPQSIRLSIDLNKTLMKGASGKQRSYQRLLETSKFISQDQNSKSKNQPVRNCQYNSPTAQTTNRKKVKNGLTFGLDAPIVSNIKRIERNNCFKPNIQPKRGVISFAEYMKRKEKSKEKSDGKSPPNDGNLSNKTAPTLSQSTQPTDPRIQRALERSQSQQTIEKSNNETNLNKKQKTNYTEVICLD